MEKRVPVSFSSAQRDKPSRPAASIDRLPVTSQDIAVRVIRSLEEFSQVAAQWDALLQSLEPVPLPLTSTWLCAWWKAFCQGEGIEMEFRCVYRGNQLVGIAPLIRLRQRHRGVAITVLKLAANGHSPYSAIVVSRTLSSVDRHKAFRLLTEVAPEEIGLFFKVDEKSALTEFLLDSTSDFAKRVGKKPSIRTPVVNIDQPWDEFYKSRPRRLKKSLNHKMNRFNRQSGFSISMEALLDPGQSLVDDMVSVSAKSWKSSIGNDLKSNAKSRKFLQGLVQSLGPSGCVNVWVVRDGKRPVAFELHMVFDGVVYPIRADYDEEYSAFSPGSVLEYTALKALFESSAITQYYTCADDYWYLSNWTSDYKDFCTIEVFGDSVKMRALYLLEYRVIPKIKRFIRADGSERKASERRA